MFENDHKKRSYVKGYYFIFIILIVLAGIYQLLWSSSEFQLDDEPTLPTHNPSGFETSEAIRFDQASTDKSNQEKIVFIVRTFRGYLPATSKLLRNLDEQLQLQDQPLQVHAVLLSTDLESIDSVQKFAGVEAKGSTKLHISVMNISHVVYNNNCCQIDTMCKDTKFQVPWNSYFHNAYRRFKPESIIKKIKQFCGANNLLHYVLTDLTISTILKTCSDCKYLTVTNGDNTYDTSFVSKVAAAFQSNSKYVVVDSKSTSLREKEIIDDGSHMEPDIVQVDYSERGKETIRTSLQHSDLAAFVYSTKSLKRFQILFTNALPAQAWPDHYYAADTLFIRYLVTVLHANVVSIREILFTHW